MEIPEEEMTADLLKDRGNHAIKENKVEEAVQYYTQAITLDPQNFTLYSNRSHAYLKIKLYYLAFKDAKQCIVLSPSWPKGYYRKGEVEFATEHYCDAFDSYREALKWKPEDLSILKALNITAKRVIRQKEDEKKFPWVGAGVGIIFGVSLLLTEFLLGRNPTNPLLMAVITIALSFVGYLLSTLYRAYVRHKRDRLLKPSDSECSEEEGEEEEEEKEEIKRTPRYTKSQARLRYKKGKA